MFKQRTYAFLALLTVLLAIFAIYGLFSFLKKRTAENSQKSDWYRFVAPTLLAVFLAFWGGHGMEMHGALQWLYFFLIAIGLPFALAYFLNKDAFEKKQDRILMLLAWLILLNVAIFTAHWNWHYRNEHAVDMQNEGQEEGNPHVSKRNWFLIPLWVLTALFGGYATSVWRSHNTKENSDDFLPM